MKVIANRQLIGEYGEVAPGQAFDVRDEVGRELLRRDLVRHAVAPRVQYETHVIAPEAPEVSPRDPFRDLPVPDEKPQKLAAESARVLSAADVSASGDADSGRRRRRPRSGS